MTIGRERIRNALKMNEEGMRLLKKARYEEAITAFTEAIYLDPDLTGAQDMRAEAYRQVDLPLEAP